MISRIVSFIATLGPIGYLPASGTIASLLSIPLLCLLPESLYWFVLTMTVLIAIAWWIIKHTISAYQLSEDPPSIVIDEVIGVFLLFYGIPLTYDNVLVGMLLFRLFDISKFGGIHMVEKASGACGVLADDILAAVYAQALLRLYLYFYW